MSSRLFIAAAVCSLGAPEALAQTARPALEPVIVTAQRLPDASSDRAFAGIKVPPERLAAGPAARLDDLLRGIGGNAQFRRATSRVANPTAQGITLRGLGGNAASRALVLLDGVPQDDPFGGWIIWPALGLEPAAITLERGGGATLAGPGALTGALTLTTGPIRTGGSASVAVASFDTVAAAASAGWAGRTASLSASVLADRSDGFVLIPQDQRGPVDIAAPSDLQAGVLRGSLALKDDTAVHGRLMLFRDVRASGLPVGDNRSRGVDASVRLVHDGGRQDWRFELTAFVKDRMFRNGFAAADAARTSASLTLDQYAVPATGYGLTAEARLPESAFAAVRLGADARWATGQTRERFRNLGAGFTRDRRAGGDSRTVGGFVDVLLRPAEQLELTAAARLDVWHLSGGFRREVDLQTGLPTLDIAFADRTKTTPSGRIGAQVALTPALKARALAYANSRAPTLNELYRPFRVGLDVTEANADLPVERLRGVEAGFRFEPANGALLDVALFWNQLEDAVGNVTLGRGPGVFPLVGFLPAGGVYRQRLALDRVRATGIEIWVQAPLWAGFAVDGGLTHGGSRITRADAAPALEGLRPAQTARTTATMRLGWMAPSGQSGASFTLAHSSAQFEDDANSRKLPALWTLGLAGHWQLTGRWRLEAGLDNLFDAKIVAGQSAGGTQTLGGRRMVRLGLSTRFGDDR